MNRCEHCLCCAKWIIGIRTGQHSRCQTDGTFQFLNCGSIWHPSSYGISGFMCTRNTWRKALLTNVDSAVTDHAYWIFLTRVIWLKMYVVTDKKHWFRSWSAGKFSVPGIPCWMVAKDSTQCLNWIRDVAEISDELCSRHVRPAWAKSGIHRRVTEERSI